MTFNYSKQVENFIDSQGKTNATRLRNAIVELPKGDVKKLQIKSKTPLLRLRVGGYRIIFTTAGETYNIIFAGNRGDVYKFLAKL